MKDLLDLARLYGLLCRTNRSEWAALLCSTSFTHSQTLFYFGDLVLIGPAYRPGPIWANRHPNRGTRHVVPRRPRSGLGALVGRH